MVILQAQIDGKVVQAKFTLPERKRVSPPPKPLATGSRRDVTRNDNAGIEAEKDGPKRGTASMLNAGNVFYEIKGCLDLLFKFII